MKAERLLLLAVGGAALLLTGGCPSASRTSDNGGGSLVSAGLKVANGQMMSLTEDEVQIVTDYAIQQSGEDITPLDNATADAVLKFISDNHLNSITDVQAAIEKGQKDPNSIVISPDVRKALDNFIAANESNFGEPTAAGVTGGGGSGVTSAD